MNHLSMELARHIRIRSWKDIVIIIALIPVVVLLQLAVKKLFPNLSEKATNVIVYVGGIIICLILLFAIGA